MAAMEWIVIWGACALGAALLAGLIANYKNRDYSAWMAWSFIVPPAVVLLMILPVNKGPRPRRPTLDELDREQGSSF